MFVYWIMQFYPPNHLNIDTDAKHKTTTRPSSEFSNFRIVFELDYLESLRNLLDSFAKIHQAEEAVAKSFCDKQSNPFIVKFECITMLSLSLNSLDRVAGKLSRFSTHQQLEET